jgi:hypothetical protein
MAITAAVLLAGCGTSSGREDDGRTDADAPPETIEDVTEEEAPPAECEGSETIAFSFVADEAAVEGVAVTVACGGDVQEATSGTDGTVTFTGLNVSARPVDVTWVHDGAATTWLAYGGARGAPAEMEIDLTEADPYESWVRVRGDVTHEDPDSIMIVSGPVGSSASRGGDQYERRAPEGGTGLPIAFLEYTAAGGTATPIGFTETTFDTPASGGDGPVADADPAAVFETVSVTLGFDLAAASPVHSRQVAEDGPLYMTRQFFGLYLSDLYEDAGGTDVDYSVQLGITTRWSKGTDSDDLVMSYVPGAITGEAVPSVIVSDHNGYWFTTKHPDWPIADGASIEMPDVPIPTGVGDPSEPLTLDDEIEVAYPAWASIVAVNLYLSTGFGAFNPEILWSVIIPPEGATFRFADLSLPSAVTPDDLLPSGTTAPQIFLSVGGIEGDGDPFDGYQGWTTDGWWEERFTGRAVDGRYLFEP